ncbi:YdcF family protein [Curtobacterium sp. MMLR14_010]|uniref:YdcF family protein n=1 Tax=Curtobacterium sp. MMLR14_010 TaxID=1898743 RepID=UPI0020C91030|nr:YdcF family protein [Curtobacterium sp. MMLR14_010]
MVVVLGIANRGHRANPVNRWRARMALRSVPSGSATTIVTSGGAVRGPIPEATLLAQYLRDRLGWRGPLIEETTSRSTWNNVENVLPLLDGADWIMLVSNSLHAEKARIYLARQRPDLAARLVPVADFRVGEMILLKPALAAIGLVKLRRLR